MPRREDAERLREQTDRLRQTREQKAWDRARRKDDRTRAHAEDDNESKLRAVEATTQKLEQDRDEYAWIDAKLENWNERNFKYQDLAGDAIARHIFWMCCILGILVIDTLLLGAAGPQIAKTAKASFGAGNWIVPAATVALSLSYIGLELCAGFNLNGKRRDLKGTSFAVLVGLAMPLTVLGLSLLNSGLISNQSGKVVGAATFRAITFTSIIFTLIALAAHGGVLIFGKQMVKGVGYAVYKLNQMRLVRRRNLLERSIAQGPDAVVSDFRAFYNAFNNGQNGNNNRGSENGSAAASAPYGARMRGVVNEVFEDEIFEEPHKRQQKDNNDYGASSKDQSKENQTREHREDTRPSEPVAEESNAEKENNSQANPAAQQDAYDWDGEDELRR